MRIEFGAMAFLAVCLGGCTLAPPGSAPLRHEVDQAGRVYDKPFAQRDLPPLPTQPSYKDILQRAFLANGELEAAYYEWKAAAEQIIIDGEWPNSRIAVGYQYAFSKESISTWNKTTLSVGFDPSVNVTSPTKTMAVAKVAYDQAVARGKRFAAAKFALQKRVLLAYYDWALVAEKLRIQKEANGLRQMIASIAAQGVQAGGAQQYLLKAQNAYDIGRVEEENLRAELASARARLNALMALPADAPLEAPAQLPAPRLLARDDAALIAAALENNPELAALAQESMAAQDRIQMNKEEYWPEFWGQFGFTGNQSFGPIASLMLPTTLNKLHAQVEQAKAAHRQSQATARQVRLDRWADMVGMLIALQNAQRQIGLYTDNILPRSRQVWETARSAYSSGSGSFGDLVETQQTLLDARLKLAEAVIDHEKRLAELEELAGVDIETLARPQSPASAPASRPTDSAPAANTDVRTMP